ncbi:MAG TPA: hypothetical protein ENH10_01060, partial [Bacteroidetes bacterium]|nr:hypothetical protein [Bacteroidota bacterium]HEX03733.1 hypothetical protein [Bacteroidota bacterium]
MGEDQVVTVRELSARAIPGWSDSDMKATAYSTRAFWARRTHPVLPVREIKLTLPLMLFAVIVLGFFFTMMHLQVRKSHYCQLIQRQSERV